MPLTGRRRAVGEDVAEVTRSGAEDLDTLHAVAAVRVGDDVPGRNRLEEARPAGAGVELGGRGEQRQAAADAGVDAVALLSSRVPQKGRSVPLPRATWNWSGVSIARHSASVLTTGGTSTGPTSLPAALNTFTRTVGHASL